MDNEYKIIRAAGTKRTYLVFKYEVMPYTFNLEYEWVQIARISLV